MKMVLFENNCRIRSGLLRNMVSIANSLLKVGISTINMYFDIPNLKIFVKLFVTSVYPWEERY
jgi:hypothetical protein